MAIKFPRRKMDTSDIRQVVATILAKGGTFSRVDRMYDSRVHARWLKLLKKHAKKYHWDLIHMRVGWKYNARDGMPIAVVNQETWGVSLTCIESISMGPGYYAIVKGVLHRIIPNISHGELVTHGQKRK